MSPNHHVMLADIASKRVLTVTPESLLEQAVACFAEQGVSSLVVVEGRRPIGIVTERDLARLMCLGVGREVTIRSVMSTPLLTAHSAMDLSSAWLLMDKRDVRHLVLVDNAGELVGVASETDFRRYLGQHLLDRIQILSTVMETNQALMPAETPLRMALEQMAAGRCDHVVVGQGTRAEGIVTERDLPRLFGRRVDAATARLGEVMSSPLVSIDPGSSIAEALAGMFRKGLRHIGVVDAEGGFVGMVSQRRILDRLGILLLEDSRARLACNMESAFEETGVGTWEFDHGSERLVRSLSLDAMLGFAPGNAGENLESLLQRVVADDRQKICEAFRELLASEAGRFHVDFRVAGANGGLRWISSRGQAVGRDASGQPVISAGVAIDITDHKRLEYQLRASESRFRRFVEEVPLPLCHVNAREELVFVNQHFREAFGYTLEDVPNLAAWWQRAYPDAAYRAWVLDTWNEAVRVAAASGSTIRPVEYRVTCANGQVRVVEISGITMGEDFLATFIDVTERRQEQALLEFSNAILERISNGAPLAEVFNFMVGRVEAQEAGMLCSVLLLDGSGRLVQLEAAPSLPAEYCAAIQRLPIGPAVGSCGTAAFRREAVFVGDIASDPLWAEYRQLALDHGLAACWSSPILGTSGEVLGTFAVYWRQPCLAVSPNVQRYVEAAGKLAAIAIESTRRDAELRRIHQGLVRAEALGQLGSWSWNVATGETYWSEQMFRLFYLEPAQTPLANEEFLLRVHPDDRPILTAVMAQMEQGEIPAPVLYRTNPELGEMRYLQPQFSLIAGAGDNGPVFEGTLSDVTVLRQSEDRLRGQLDELRRWQQLTLGREGRILELKGEVNALLARLGEGPRYGATNGGGGAP